MTGSTEQAQARRLRALRGTAAAAIAVLLASTAHTLSGGDAPPLWLIVAVTVLAAPLCVALVGRRRSVPRIAVSVVVAQLALHAAFAAVGTAAPAGPAALGSGHHHALLLWEAGSSDPAAATMNVGHALAALLTVVLLAWGEQLLAAIARGIRRLLRGAPAVFVGHPQTVPMPSPRRSRATTATFLRCLSRRGPPAHSAFGITA